MARPLTNPLALAVLTLLAEEPMHPYQMSTTLKERRKEHSIKLNFGSLYSVVESLLRRGMIDVRGAHREGNRPERTIYGITDEGEETMRSWLGAMLSTPAKDFPEFEAALSLMPVLAPDEVASLLGERLERLRSEREALAHLLQRGRDAAMPRLFTIEHDYELAVLDVEERFVGQLLTELRDGSFDGLDIWARRHRLRADGRSESEIDAILREEMPGRFDWMEELTD